MFSSQSRGKRGRDLINLQELWRLHVAIDARVAFLSSKTSFLKDTTLLIDCAEQRQYAATNFVPISLKLAASKG